MLISRRSALQQGLHYAVNRSGLQGGKYCSEKVINMPGKLLQEFVELLEGSHTVISN